MCANGQCADGYALFAIVQNTIGNKTLRLQSTTLSDAEAEAKERKSQEDTLLYIESRRVMNDTH